MPTIGKRSVSIKSKFAPIFSFYEPSFKIITIVLTEIPAPTTHTIFLARPSVIYCTKPLIEVSPLRTFI